MLAVDNVAARLSAARLSKAAALAAASRTPERNALTNSKWHYHTKNNLGRYDWAVKTTEPLETVFPGISYFVCLAKPDTTGEYMSYIHCCALVHHKTLEHLLRLQGLQVLYMQGCSKNTIDTLCSNPLYSVNKLV